MTDDKQAQLRKPFPKGSVGILPKPYKKDSPKGKCGECGGYHGLPAVHLDYVGHAVTTGRLLDVDPAWTWEPMGRTPDGLPALDRQGNLWIKLTVLGVSRYGVGDGSSMKEQIGDAIRNAAMRFGVALDLWSKEELEQGELPAPPTPPEPPAHERPASADGLLNAKRRAWNATRGDDDTRTAIIREFLTTLNVTPETATVDHWVAAAEELSR